MQGILGVDVIIPFLLFSFFFNFFGGIILHVESLFPDQGLNPYPLYQKQGVLTTRSPRKSRDVITTSLKGGVPLRNG